MLCSSGAGRIDSAWQSAVDIERRCAYMGSSANSRTALPELQSYRSRVQMMHHVFCSGESESAGLLFRSWNVSEGNAAILYDFDRNILEAVFEVSTRLNNNELPLFSLFASCCRLPSALNFKL